MVTRATIVELLKAAAVVWGDEITPSRFLRLHQWTPEENAIVLTEWPLLRSAAGLTTTGRRRGNRRFTHDDLLSEYDRVFRKHGKDPTWAELNRESSISTRTFYERIGNIPEVRQAHREWLQLRDKAARGDADACRRFKERTIADGTVRRPHDEQIADLVGTPPPLPLDHPFLLRRSRDRRSVDEGPARQAAVNDKSPPV